MADPEVVLQWLEADSSRTNAQAAELFGLSGDRAVRKLKAQAREARAAAAGLPAVAVEPVVDVPVTPIPLPPGPVLAREVLIVHAEAARSHGELDPPGQPYNPVVEPQALHSAPAAAPGARRPASTSQPPLRPAASRVTSRPATDGGPTAAGRLVVKLGAAGRAASRAASRAAQVLLAAALWLAAASWAGLGLALAGLVAAATWAAALWAHDPDELGDRRWYLVGLVLAIIVIWWAF